MENVTYQLRESIKFKGQEGGLNQAFTATRTIFHLDLAQAIAKATKELAEKSGMDYHYDILEIGQIVETSYDRSSYAHGSLKDNAQA